MDNFTQIQKYELHINFSQYDVKKNTMFTTAESIIPSHALVLLIIVIYCRIARQ